MSDERNRINVAEGVSGKNITITQIYASGHTGLTADFLDKRGNTKPFSADWLIFVEESVSFFGRDDELIAIGEFLADPRPFAWWAVVGGAGAGKSRLALEAIKRSTGEWDGGFIPKSEVSADRVAAWRPVGNTFWVLDYAAGYHGDKLREIISIFARLAHRSDFKVRLILLERGYSEETGWWPEMMMSIGRDRSAVIASLYREPMTLKPIATGARAFLDRVADSLPVDDGQILTKALDSVADHWLLERSDNGNPLILQMLASEIVRAGGAVPQTFTADARGIIESYFAREIEMLHFRSKKAGLNFSHALNLLFVTTSMFPIKYLPKRDLQDASSNDIKSALVENTSFQYLLPRVEQLGKLDRETASEQNQIVLEQLSKVTEIDDVVPYLALLDDLGFSEARLWAVQPDLLGETLIRFIVNSPVVSPWLKQKRPEFSRQRVSRLIEGILVHQSDEQAYRNWAKLDNVTLSILTRHLETQGKSIRLMLLAIRMLNRMRDSKIPFDPKVAFTGRDRQMGHYFERVQTLISRQSASDKELSRLSRNEFAWVLPYFEFLLDLSMAQKLVIASLICRVDSKSVLKRLTNLANFSYVLMSYVTSIGSSRRKGTSIDPSLSLGRFVDETMTFLCDQAYPVLIDSGDREFKDVYRWIAMALGNCSYAILLEYLNRNETPASRARARRALAIARAAMEIAPDASIVAKLERTHAALVMMDTPDERAAVMEYFDTLRRMQDYASPADYTGTLIDFLNFNFKRGTIDALKEGFAHITLAAAANLIVPNAIVLTADAIAKGIIEGDGDQNAKCRILVHMCRSIQALFYSGDKESIVSFQEIMCNAILAAEESQSLQAEIVDLLGAAGIAMNEGRCSQLFINAILSLAGFCRVSWGDAASAPPFLTMIAVPDEGDLARARNGLTEEDYRRSVKQIIKVEVSHHLPSGRVCTVVTFVVVGVSRKGEPHDSFERSPHEILQAIRENLEGKLISTISHESSD